MGDSPTLVSISFSSPYLVQHGHADIVDEVRAVLRDEQGTTAFFLFTTQFGAASNELRLFGKAGNLVLDNTYRTVLRIPPSQHKSYLRYFLAPLGPGPRAGAQLPRQRAPVRPEGVPDGLRHEED